jgi:site-specific DNA-methyltransferase (adenine-specific)
MGKDWDATTPGFNFMTSAIRVLSPGGYMAAFGSPKTIHGLATEAEKAGFEIRDTISWVHGQGMPIGGQDLSKSTEAMLTLGSANKTAYKLLSGKKAERKSWSITEHTVRHGQRDVDYAQAVPEYLEEFEPTTEQGKALGGWNTVLRPVHESILLARKPCLSSVTENVLKHVTGGLNVKGAHPGRWAANVVFCPKPTTKEKDAGLQGRNPSASVKPIELMRWLVRLLTPAGGLVMDPYAGSGTTGCACVLENVDFLGVEQDPEVAAAARRRIRFWENVDMSTERYWRCKSCGTDGHVSYADGKERSDKRPTCPACKQPAEWEDAEQPSLFA